MVKLMKQIPFFILLFLLFAQCSNTQHNESERKQLIEQYQKNMAIIDEENERNSIIQQSKNSSKYFLYNEYVTGEFKKIRVNIDIYNAIISRNGKFLLLPTRIINNSNTDLLLDPTKDKLYFIFYRKTYYDTCQIHPLNMPNKILAGNDCFFITKYIFKDEDECAGFTAALHLSGIYLDWLNSEKGNSETNSLKNNENNMKNTWKGKFVVNKLGFTVSLYHQFIKNNTVTSNNNLQKKLTIKPK